MARPTAFGINNFQNIMNLFIAGLGTEGLFEEPIRGLPEASGQLNFNINNLSNMFGPVLSQALNLRGTFRQARPDISENPWTSGDPDSATRMVDNISGSFEPLARGMDDLATTVTQNDPNIRWKDGGVDRAVSHGVFKNADLAGNDMSQVFGFVSKFLGTMQSFRQNKRGSAGPDQRWASSDFDNGPSGPGGLG